MKTPVVLLGAGGHAKVVIEILEETGDFEIVGCLSPTAQESTLLGYPILGGDDLLPALFQQGVRHAFVAVGANAARRRLAQKVRESGFDLASAICPRALVSPRARLGRGVAVMPGAVINVDTVVGEGAIVNTAAVLDHDDFIGAFAHVAPGASLAGSVTAQEGAFLGTGCSVIPGIIIGTWTVVGAGAVVIRDLPADVTAVGVPARVIKRNA
jgi:UDP-perosamine 4-acetyltransferase